MKYNADVNIQDNTEHTLLHYASYLGNAQLAKILLKSGADCNLQYKDGFSS